MAYVQIPTRSSADANAAADINQLQDNLDYIMPTSGDWVSYTPTVTASTGTITSASASGRYILIGKTCILKVIVTITTNGTGSGYLEFTLPFSSTIYTWDSGSGALADGSILSCGLYDTTHAYLARYDGTYAGADSTSYLATMVYEVV